MSYTLIGKADEIEHGEKVEVLSKSLTGWEIRTEDGRTAKVSHTRLKWNRPEGQLLKGWGIQP